MKNNKLKTKIISLIIAFVIAVILSGIISMILHLIFIKVPEEILNITPTKILKSLIENKEHFEMFILTIISFMLFALLTIFKVFDLKYYISDMNTSQENFQSILAYAVRRHDLSAMSS